MIRTYELDVDNAYSFTRNKQYTFFQVFFKHFTGQNTTALFEDIAITKSKNYSNIAYVLQCHYISIYISMRVMLFLMFLSHGLFKMKQTALSWTISSLGISF